VRLAVKKQASHRVHMESSNLKKLNEVEAREKVLLKACYHSVPNHLSSRPLSKNVKMRIYETIILSTVLYGYEIWSLTSREEQRLRVFENKVLRIFGPKRDEVTEGWRKLLNEELCNLYSSPSTIKIIKSKRMRWAGHVGRMGEKRKATGYWWESQREIGH
jgi:hypothetical protein